MGILNTLETMLNAMEKSREVQYDRNFTSLNHFFCSRRNWKLLCLNWLQIVYQLEQVVISLIAKVLELSVMGRILHCESVNARWSFFIFRFNVLQLIVLAIINYQIIYIHVCLFAFQSFMKTFCQSFVHAHALRFHSPCGLFITCYMRLSRGMPLIILQVKRDFLALLNFFK